MECAKDVSDSSVFSAGIVGRLPGCADGEAAGYFRWPLKSFLQLFDISLFHVFRKGKKNGLT